MFAPLGINGKGIMNYLSIRTILYGSESLNMDLITTVLLVF
jgi:hypothetical protein